MYIYQALEYGRTRENNAEVFHRLTRGSIYQTELGLKSLFMRCYSWTSS